jgi:glycopeptide antibiotics resistance protein
LIALAFVVFLPSREAGAVTGFVGVIAMWLTNFGVPVGQAAVGIDFVLNIVLFVPFGGLIRLLWPSTWFWWRMLFMGAAASSIIELTQLLIPGRVTAFSDVIGNSAGAMLGALAAKWLLCRCVV